MILALASGHRPTGSALGIAWTAVTATVMFALAAGKSRTGAAAGNPVLTTEARVTPLDALSAAAVLVEVGLDARWPGGGPTRSLATSSCESDTLIWPHLGG